MPRVRSYDNEPFESTLRRFKKAVDNSDILRDLREREFYEKPSTKRKKNKAAAIKRRQRQERLDSLPNQNRKY